MEGGFLKNQNQNQKEIQLVRVSELEPKLLQKKRGKKARSRGRISYSELKLWNECAFKHKLVYIDKIDYFKGNEYTAFGKAVHSVCEELLPNPKIDFKKHFRNIFLKELKFLKKSGIILKAELINQMRLQGEHICEYILPAVKEKFSDYEIVSIEEPLMEEIDDFESEGLKFKGFIDLVLKTSDGKVHIIDWKTCSWGWDMQRKTNRITTYQLTLYKHFYAKKHNIDVKNIETHFALLKRTAKKDIVEIFRVTSGIRKTKNALALLEKAVRNINAENYTKNRLVCSRCQYYKTEDCPS